MRRLIFAFRGKTEKTPESAGSAPVIVFNYVPWLIDLHKHVDEPASMMLRDRVFVITAQSRFAFGITVTA